jgi:hypothetical protein
MARMNDEEKTRLENGLKVIRDGWEQFGITKDEAIQIVVDAIAGRNLISVPTTSTPAQEPIPFKEPDNRPRKILLEDERESDTPHASALFR